ncbi:hypothetical protein MSG28_016000 [Choristoneura fumiferana]|uniref:Uncharacterized protein n=1 Tax=Choristoneura fumiferana TaxID=7141 RepID=A0ACC0K5J6_CHOFU|nr:hypothetical protein MSG28_016000 [Choristoneura fumiferana]
MDKGSLVLAIFKEWLREQYQAAGRLVRRERAIARKERLENDPWKDESLQIDRMFSEPYLLIYDGYLAHGVYLASGVWVSGGCRVRPAARVMRRAMRRAMMVLNSTHSIFKERLLAHAQAPARAPGRASACVNHDIIRWKWDDIQIVKNNVISGYLLSLLETAADDCQPLNAGKRILSVLNVEAPAVYEMISSIFNVLEDWQHPFFMIFGGFPAYALGYTNAYNDVDCLVPSSVNLKRVLARSGFSKTVYDDRLSIDDIEEKFEVWTNKNLKIDFILLFDVKRSFAKDRALNTIKHVHEYTYAAMCYMLQYLIKSSDSVLCMKGLFWGKGIGFDVTYGMNLIRESRRRLVEHYDHPHRCIRELGSRDRAIKYVRRWTGKHQRNVPKLEILVLIFLYHRI